MNKILPMLIFATVMIGCATTNQMHEEIPMGDVPAERKIDVRGKRITTYILYNVVENLKNMNTDEVLEVITDNYVPIDNDMQAWSRLTGNRIISTDKESGYYLYFIKKTNTTRQQPKFVMVISSNGLEELLSPLGFALASAINGNEVHIFFQGPAVQVFKRGFRESLPGINAPFSSFARKGLNDIGHVPPQEKLEQLDSLGAFFYLCGPSMDHFKVKESELILDKVTIAEYITFLEAMEKADMFMQF